MTSPKPTEASPEIDRRFRGNWAPLIRDPAKFHYLPTATKALEKATEQHDRGESEQLEEEEEEKQEIPPEIQSSKSSSEAPKRDVLLRDALEASERVERLKKRNPGIDLDALCALLIEAKCKQGALVGLCAAGPAMLLPGWGSLATVLLGGVADLTLTTKLEADLALEIACLYGLFEVYCAEPTARRNYLLHVAGLEGLDEQQKSADEDEKATREAGERLAVRATEEVGKRSLISAIPIVGGAVGAGTNVVGIYVIGRRAQMICKGESVGTWRESINKYAVPADIARGMAVQMSRIPSAVTVRIAQVTTSIGMGARRLMASSSTYISASYPSSPH
jgi:hypothetical protein